MRGRTVQVVLALMIVMPAVVGLYTPTWADDDSSDTVVGTPIGFTFSGVQRSIKTGAIEIFEESPIGPFTGTGLPNPGQLTWNKGQSVTYLECDPSQAVTSISESVIDNLIYHFLADLSSTSGQVNSLDIVVPTIENAGGGTTTDFPVDLVQALFRYPSDLDTPIEVPMTRVQPQADEDLRYRATFDPPLTAVGMFEFDIIFSGQVEPPLSGDPTVTSLGCPPPNDDLTETIDFGVTQMNFFDTDAVINTGDSGEVSLQADMELVEKVASPDPALVHVSFTYTITVKNNGPDRATGIIFLDVLDSNALRNISASVGSVPCTVGENDGDPGTTAVACVFERSLDSGDSATIQIRAIPETVGTLRNGRASIVASETDLDPDNNRNQQRPTITSVVNVDQYITAVVGALVAGLQGDGSDQLDSGQAQALFATLRAASRSFARGDYVAARNQIEAFRRQVDSVGGHLPEEQRRALRTEADRMLRSMDIQNLGQTPRGGR